MKFVFGLGMIISGILVITSLKPVSAIIGLIMAFLNGAGVLIGLGEDFIGSLYIIIYVGAIVILFLFVIMLLNIERESFLLSLKTFLSLKPMSIAIGSLYIGILYKNYIYYLIYGSIAIKLETFASIEKSKSVTIIGEILYRYWNYEILLLISLILLVGMIGAIILTIDKKSNYETFK